MQVSSQSIHSGRFLLMAASFASLQVTASGSLNECTKVIGGKAGLRTEHHLAEFVGLETPLDHKDDTFLHDQYNVKKIVSEGHEIGSNLVFNALRYDTYDTRYTNHIDLSTTNQGSRHVVFKVYTSTFDENGDPLEDHIDWFNGQQFKACSILYFDGRAPRGIVAQAIRPKKSARK